MVKGNPHKGGVVAHPHPLYGGSMNNNVVTAAMEALSATGFSALRFNFRGVGRSTGEYGHGVAERSDLIAAVRFLKHQGVEQPLVLGYSFGAHVAAFAWPGLKKENVRPLILIAPPAARMSFEDLPAPTRIGLIIYGEWDQYAPGRMVRDLGRRLTHPTETVMVKGTDHFFSGHESKLKYILNRYLTGIESP